MSAPPRGPAIGLGGRPLGAEQPLLGGEVEPARHAPDPGEARIARDAPTTRAPTSSRPRRRRRWPPPRAGAPDRAPAGAPARGRAASRDARRLGALRARSSRSPTRCSTSTTATGSGSRPRGSRTSRPRAARCSSRNHSGALPPDGPMIMQAIRNEHRRRRPLYMLGEHWFKGYPGVGMLANKLGRRPRPPGERAAPARATRAGWRSSSPRGRRAAGKVLWQRYRLRRFGRGGFVRTALRAGCRSCRSRWSAARRRCRSSPTCAALQRITGLIYFPLNHAFPHFGLAAGAMYMPAKFRIRFLEPIDLPALPAGHGRGRRRGPGDRRGDPRPGSRAELDEMLAEREVGLARADGRIESAPVAAGSD